MSTKLLTFLCALALTTSSLVTNAATCTFPIPNNNSVLGDSLYGPRVCNQSHINKFWRDFDFDKGDWDDGFGYYSACDINRPLNRTFSSLWLLLYSSPTPATSTSDFNGNFLRWAYNYSAREIDELDGRCSNDALATTYWGWFVNDRTQLKFPFFYGQGVPERAGTIVHEARHADGKGHVSDCCPRGASCDSYWLDYRANTYQVIYLGWFIHSGTNTTTAMKRRAQSRANSILRTGFCKATSFRYNYSI